MENKDGYELDPLLETVLEEQMIEGDVPESEVDPSIKDIEEAMDERLKEKKSNQEYDAEAYANVPEEFNQKLIELMGHMRAAGVPQETIMSEIRDLIDIYVSSNPNNMQTNNQVNNMDNNFEVGRSGIPDEHISSAFTPEELNSKLSDWNDGYSDEELDAIDNPAQPTAAEKVGEYLDKHNEEGSELWTHLWEGSRALSSGNVEDGAAHLRILVEIFQNLLSQLDEGRTASTHKVAARVEHFTVNSDTELGELEVGLDNGDYIMAKNIDLEAGPSRIVDNGFTTDLPSQPFVSQPGVERDMPTNINVGSVEYYTVESDGNPAALYGTFSQAELENLAKYVDVESIYQPEVPEEIKSTILSIIESNDEINQQLDQGTCIAEQEHLVNPGLRSRSR